MGALHFLHVGKTGGSSVKEAIAGWPGITLHPHGIRLADIPVGEPVFFTIREPLARYVSAFNSRLRAGRPRYDVAWSEGEARAFALFTTPDQLAVAVGRRDPAAIAAMRDITHLNQPLSWWFSAAELARRAGDIVAILLQAELAADFDHPKRRLALTGELPTDSVAAHVTPASFDRRLSEAGAAALRRWYSDDVALFQACLEMRQAILSRAPCRPPQSLGA